MNPWRLRPSPFLWGFAFSESWGCFAVSASPSVAHFMLVLDIMETKPNPIRARKWREVNDECPYYDECFNHAVLRNWLYWTCSKCPNKSTRHLVETETSASEPLPHI